MNLDEMGEEELQNMVRQKLVGHDEQQRVKAEGHTCHGGQVMHQTRLRVCGFTAGRRLDKLICARKIMLDLYRI